MLENYHISYIILAGSSMNLITDVMNVALTQGHTSNTAFKGSNNFFQHESEECFLL